MISFVWSSKHPFVSGSGGSESYTAGHIRELNSRGIPARLITIGHGEKDGRDDFPDIEFLALSSADQLADLDDTIVFVTYPLDVKTKWPSYAILHCPPPNCQHGAPLCDRKAFRGRRLITAGEFAAGMWRMYLKAKTGRMPTVYPFADPVFGEVQRDANPSGQIRILFAGRLSADKGIYTLLAALHMESLQDLDIRITATRAGSFTEEGKIIEQLLEAHPKVKLINARKTPLEMAKLMGQNDIVIMPSSDIFWKELFGMLSIEAQHAGCRVVASRTGGLPETNCGGVVFTRPDDPKVLAEAIVEAAKLGPLNKRERQAACKRFTIEASVDSLLKAINYRPPAPQRQPRKGLAVPNLPFVVPSRLSQRSRQ